MDAYHFILFQYAEKFNFVQGQLIQHVPSNINRTDERPATKIPGVMNTARAVWVGRAEKYFFCECSAHAQKFLVMPLGCSGGTGSLAEQPRQVELGWESDPFGVRSRFWTMFVSHSICFTPTVTMSVCMCAYLPYLNINN